MYLAPTANTLPAKFGEIRGEASAFDGRKSECLESRELRTVRTSYLVERNGMRGSVSTLFNCPSLRYAGVQTSRFHGDLNSHVSPWN
jgi:hypothetical protein